MNRALKQFGTSLGFATKNGRMYGMVKDFMVTVYSEMGHDVVFVNAYLDGERGPGIAADLGTFLESQKAILGFVGFEISKTGIAIRFPSNGKAVANMSAALMQLTDRMLSTVPRSVCTVSGRPLTPGTEVKVQVKGNVYLCDAQTAKEIMEGMPLDAKPGEVVERERKSPAFYLTGALGGILGGLVGSIPWVVYTLGYFVGWLGFLIGIAVQKGYEILRGPVSKLKVVIILLISLAMVVVAQFAGVCVSVYMTLSSTVYKMEVMELVKFIFEYVTKDPVGRGEFIKELLFGMVFAVLGLIGVIQSTWSEQKVAKMKPEIIM